MNAPDSTQATAAEPAIDSGTELAVAQLFLADALHHLRRAAGPLEEIERGAIEMAAADIERIRRRVQNVARLVRGGR